MKIYKLSYPPGKLSGGFFLSHDAMSERIDANVKKDSTLVPCIEIGDVFGDMAVYSVEVTEGGIRQESELFAEYKDAYEFAKGRVLSFCSDNGVYFSEITKDEVMLYADAPGKGICIKAAIRKKNVFLGHERKEYTVRIPCQSYIDMTIEAASEDEAVRKTRSFLKENNLDVSEVKRNMVIDESDVHCVPKNIY